MKAARILRRARLRAGFTQRQLAAQAGVPQPSISRIEAGVVSPGVNTLDRLLRHCGMELEAQDRLGEGLDRSVIRELLALSPLDRLRRAEQSSASMDRLLAARDAAG